MSTSETTETAVADLVSVSVAARMLGVSASSLRAWAAAGIVPHRRTAGGHRRFDPRELQQWLAARGGLPPEPTHHAPSELLPTRIDTVPGMSSGIREMREDLVEQVQHEMETAGIGTSVRTVAARRRRLSAATDALAEAVESGDLAGSFREAEWQGYRGGASGIPGETSLMEILAFRRAVERVSAARLGHADRRVVERARDRMAIRTVIGYSEGLRERRRSQRG